MKHLTSPDNVPGAIQGTAEGLAAPGRAGAGGTYRRRFLRPFSRSSWSSTFLTASIAQMAAAAIAITAASIQGAYAKSVSSASICDPFDPQLLGFQLFKLWTLATAVNFFVLLGALLVRDAFHAWIERGRAGGG